MVIALLVAGIGLLLVGLLTAGFGLQLELSFGNTLILTGAIMACTGAIMLGFWMVVRELKNIALRLGAGIPADTPASWLEPAANAPDSVAPEESGFLFPRDQPAPGRAGNAGPSSPLPWHEQGASRERRDAPAEAAPAAKPRRNLMFSSSSRKERERAEGRTADYPADLRSPPSAAPLA